MYTIYTYLIVNKYYLFCVRTHENCRIMLFALILFHIHKYVVKCSLHNNDLYIIIYYIRKNNAIYNYKYI